MYKHQVIDMSVKTDVLVIQPPQKVGESRGSTSLNDDWVADCALPGFTNVAIVVENHLVKKLGVGSQSCGIDFEALSINLVMF